MTVQSEYQLENELISQLKQLGYASITLKDESQLLSNLKTQVECANGLAPPVRNGMETGHQFFEHGHSV